MDPLASGRRLVEKPGCAVVELGTYGMEKRLFDAIAGLREEEALSVVEEMMATGADAWSRDAADATVFAEAFYGMES